MKKWLNEKVFVSNKKTLLFISIVFFSLLFIYTCVLFCFDTYFNSNSDDIVQYSPILIQYINYFKEGKLSFYNFSNNVGASVFADVYYVPLDVFSLLIFLLSFIMDSTIAFSIVNLSKILLGIIVFACFLQRKGFKNWIVVVLSFMYFSFGGCWTLSVYPTWFSLYFYLPLSLLILDYYTKGKKWLMPLYSFILVLYNFYNAYVLFWFMALVFVVVKIRDDYVSIKKLLADVVVLGLNFALGVLMALFLFLPSVLYILSYSARMVGSFEFIFEFNIYLRMLSKLFVYETGVMTFAMSGGYIQGNFNYYIGSFSLILLVIMFNMKDRISKIYKYSLMCVMVMMVIPLFSMIFSGVAMAYTRWFNLMNIILIYMVGHVLNNINLVKLEKKKLLKSLLIVACLYGVCFLIYLGVIVFNSFDDITEYKQIFIQLICFILFGGIFLLSGFFVLSKKKDLIYSVMTLEMIICIMINFSVSFVSGSKLDNININNELNEVVDKLDVKEDSLERVYANSGIDLNKSRYMKILTNETTFHSFLTRNIYDYFDLYSNKGIKLYDSYLQVVNPYASRVMDYRYIVVDKEENLGKLDFWKIVYENDQYIVYENSKYEQFYVYEDYYLEEEVKQYNENWDLFSLQKQLFNGVVLDAEKENLNKLNYNYIKTEKIDLIKEMDAYEISENLYELDISRFAKLGYEVKSIYIKKMEDVGVTVKVVDNQTNQNECNEVANVYYCEVSYNSNSILIEGDASKLSYLYTVNIDEIEYILSFTSNQSNKKYFNYSKEKEKPIIMKNKNLETKECFFGICVLEDFEVDHILDEEIIDSFIYEGKSYMYSFYDDLDYYNLNRSDNLASNKELTYNKSTISVRYRRESNSGNNQVVVLPITYSDEWAIEGDSAGYELVRVNGGFLGVIVKNNVKDINVDITFKPKGVKTGFIGSIIGFGVYGMYCAFYYLKRKREKDEII